MKIFNKKFEDIEFSDIQALVDNKVNESQVLEYKERYTPKQTASLISAFANTYGGFIVYGIKEDEINNEPDEIINVENDKLENTIDSVCYDLITPPVFCESKYVTNDKKTKRVFIVKVPESDLTPHAIDNNTTVYIKVNAQKRKIGKASIEKASIEQQEWLKDRRKKAVKLRDDLIGNIVDENNLNKQNVNIASQYNVQILIYVLYPKRFVKIKDFYSIVTNCIRDYRVEHPFTVIDYKTTENYNGGIVTTFKDEIIDLIINYNINGLFNFSIVSNKTQNGSGRINVDQIVLYIYTAMVLAEKFLSEIGCTGSIGIKCLAANLKDSKLTFEYSDGFSIPTLSNTNCTVENVLPITKEYSQLNSENFHDYIIEFISELLFVYNVHENISDSAEKMYIKGLKLFNK